jgi:hypothetical protein
VYVALSLAMDPSGYLGTDTGAKVATLEAMDRAGTTSPDVGYWAERWDPDGKVHPLYQTRHMEDGSWVAVTTLPMLEAALPLYRLAGYRLALLIPMLGGLACAVSARAIARRLGDAGGWTAFWVVGLGSPVVVYSLDLWEHSLGMGATLGAIALLLGAVSRRPPWWHAVVAGVLLGAAATLRTEAIVYALVAVGATTIAVLVRERRVLRPVVLGASAVTGFVASWLANRALELDVGGVSRTARATGAANSAAEHASGRAGDRVGEGLVTLLGVKGDLASSWCIGIGLVAVLLLAVRAHRKGDLRLAGACFVLAAVVYLVSAISDFAFIPGLIPAFPLAIGAVLVRQHGDRALVLGVALGALPLVWAFQYLGGAGPQWGGRYILTSSVLLGTLALVSLTGRHTFIRRGLVTLSVGVNVLGVVWVGVRTRSVDALFDDLHAVDADVLVVRDAFLLREGGPVVLDEHWLTASGEEPFAFALEVAKRSGATTVAVVEPGAAAPPPSAIPAGWVEQERSVTELTGDPIGVVVYRLP